MSDPTRPDHAGDERLVDPADNPTRNAQALERMLDRAVRLGDQARGDTGVDFRMTVRRASTRHPPTADRHDDQ